MIGHNAFRTDFGIAFGGFKQSGIGREGGREGLIPLLETKTAAPSVVNPTLAIGVNPGTVNNGDGRIIVTWGTPTPASAATPAGMPGPTPEPAPTPMSGPALTPKP